MKTKKFDCVDMKRRGAERVRQQLEGKSFDEEMKYWAEKTKKLRKLQKEVRQKM